MASLFALWLLAATFDDPTHAERAARFWSAVAIEERDAEAAAWRATSANFDDVHAALVSNRVYADDAPTGYLLGTRDQDGVVHPYLVLVPDNYTPDRAWPLRFQLHGGMGAPKWDTRRAHWADGWAHTESSLMVFPAGWRESMWWHQSQAENFEGILRELRATWNIDENRVIAVGNSDGGAATFFLAMRMPDHFAGYVGHVAPPDRLVRDDLGPDGQMHVDNLRDQRFHLGYGERDRKVPIKHLRRYMELFEKAGALLDWYVLEDKGHDLHLSDERVRAFMRFIDTTHRDPLPDRLTWSAERIDRYARRSWVIIDRLSDPMGGVDESRVLPRWGTPIQMHGERTPYMPFGTLDVVREGNHTAVTARDVDAFTLLLSPAEFDFTRDITLSVNGVDVRDERVAPSVETLLHWAARDDDRTTLYAAEWNIEQEEWSNDGK